jgi:hypothetical protein
MKQVTKVAATLIVLVILLAIMFNYGQVATAQNSSQPAHYYPYDPDTGDYQADTSIGIPSADNSTSLSNSTTHASLNATFSNNCVPNTNVLF